MSSNCYSGNFPSSSFGGNMCYSGSSCRSSCPSNLVYTTDLCSPSTCQLGSSLHSGCQETCYKPSSCQTSGVVSKPCQVPCYQPRTSIVCNPCETTYTGSLGFGPNSSCSLGYRTRSSSSLGCGTSGLRSPGYGVCGFPSQGYRSGFCCPPYFPSRSCQSSCYQPTCVSGFY